MGLRAGGALRRASAGPGAPDGQGPSGAQGGSIHSGCIDTVHNVPIAVLIRPLPSVLDPVKVQSLVDTILEDPDSVPPSTSSGSKGPKAVTTTTPLGLPPLCSLPAATERDHSCQAREVYPFRPEDVPGCIHTRLAVATS